MSECCWVKLSYPPANRCTSVSLWLISAHALRDPPDWAVTLVSKSVSVWSSCGWVWDQRSLLATLYDLKASQRGFASNKPPLIDPRSMLGLLDSWSESESVRKRWPHSTDLGQNPSGRLDQRVKNVHVCTVRTHLLRVHSLLRRKRAHSSLCRSTNQRAHNRNVYWSSSVCVTRARPHQAPFTCSSPFHTQMTFKGLHIIKLKYKWQNK